MRPFPGILRIGIMATSALGLLAACGVQSPFSGLMPLTNQEQTQIAALRQLKMALSPHDSIPLATLQRNVSYVLSLGLPSTFGVDLTPYWAPLPVIAPQSPPPGISYDRDSGTGEINRIVTPASELDFSFHPGDTSYQYLVALAKSPDGTTGMLQATTTGVNWLKGTPPLGSPYVFGEGFFPQTPQSLSMSLNMNQVFTHDAITGTLEMDQFQPEGSGFVPRVVTLHAQLPHITLDLHGQYAAPTTLAMQGTLQVQTQAGPQSYQVTSAVASQGEGLTLDLLSTDLDLAITLHLGAGAPTGEARSTTEYNRTLATLGGNAGMPRITYRDGSTDTWDW